MDNVIEEIHELAIYLAGFAAGKNDEKLRKASEWMAKLSRNICVGAMIGCNGGAKCTSDHK